MTDTIDRRRLTEVISRIDPHGKLLNVWPLAGGVSAQVIAFEMEHPDGHTQKLVLRLHGERDRAQNPHVAAHEFRLLQVLAAAGLAAPKPRYLDESGELFPTPYIVVDYVEGETDFAPADTDGLLRQMAAYLARLHGIDGTHADLSFLPDKAQGVAARLVARPKAMDEWLDEERIRDALEAVWPLPSYNRPVLLHGDFWPGNVLWRDGELVAVVDWEDAAMGDPLADLANSRLEILWAFGSNAMQRFTQRYKSHMQLDYTRLPYWDLYAALRPIATMAGWGLDAEVLRTMRARHRWFSGRAISALSDC